MKTTIAVITVLVLSYLFFAYSSKAPEGVQQATVTDVSSSTDMSASGTTATDAAGTSTGAAAGTSLSINLGANAGVAGAISSKYKVQDFTFQFTGYGPGGKQETGTFKNMTIGDIQTDKNGVPTSGKLTIETSSVTTGKAGLNKHLCSDDFFNCAKYPTITFTYKSIKMVSLTKATVTGTLAYNGATKDVSFDVTIDPKTMSATADFLLDTTPFKFKYTGVNKDVRIQFGFKIAEVK